MKNKIRKFFLLLLVGILMLGFVAGLSNLVNKRQTSDSDLGVTLSAQIADFGAQIEANNNEMLELQKEIENKQSLINEKQLETNATVAAEIEELYRQKAALGTRVAELERENQKINVQIADLQNQINELRNVQVTRGCATMTSNVVEGAIFWERTGNVVVVTMTDIVFSSVVSHNHGTVYFEDLPKASTGKTFLFTLVPYIGGYVANVRLGINTVTGQINNHWSDVSMGVHYFGQIVYCVE